MTLGKWYRCAVLLILSIVTLSLYHQFRIILQSSHNLRPLSTIPSPSMTHSRPTEIVQIREQKIKNTGRVTNPYEDAPVWKRLNKSDREGVETFLIFIGWPRSCHSIIGSMLDAHPNVIVAHEYFLFTQLKEHRELRNKKVLFDRLYMNSYMSAMDGWRTTNQTQKGYNLKIEDSWQGQFSHLKVIGDKCGGDATRIYHKSKHQFKITYETLKSTVKVPIKVLQVVRNPFDMIATMALYRGSGEQDKKVNATRTNKFNNQRVLRSSIISVLQLADAIMNMVPEYDLSPLEVHCEDLITHPVQTISQICQFLNLECSADYLEMCADKTFKNVSESRHLVQWNANTLFYLSRKIKKYPFFDQYSV